MPLLFVGKQTCGARLFNIIPRASFTKRSITEHYRYHPFFLWLLPTNPILMIAKFIGVKAAVNYGLNKLRFISPVHVDANLRVKVVLKEVKDIKGGIQVVSEVTFEVEGGDKPAAIAESVALYYF